MATYIPRIEDFDTELIPNVLRVNENQDLLLNLGQDYGPNEVTDYIERMGNLPETTGLIPGYRIFTPTDQELNRFNRVVNTPNTYTFFRDSGLTISFYLCNHPDLGLVMIYMMTNMIGWYHVDINNLIRR